VRAHGGSIPFLRGLAGKERQLGSARQLCEVWVETDPVIIDAPEV
jgi:hypothetical protein